MDEYTKCNYCCSRHDGQCIRPIGHKGLHTCDRGCNGGNDYGMFGSEEGEHLKFVKLEE